MWTPPADVAGANSGGGGGPTAEVAGAASGGDKSRASGVAVLWGSRLILSCIKVNKSEN